MRGSKRVSHQMCGRIINSTEKSSSEKSMKEIHARIYYGGVEDSIRREVWPYLLGHVVLGESMNEVLKRESELQSCYEHKLSEWGALEAIVQQHDREVAATNIAKFAISDGIDFNATADDTEVIEENEDEDDGECQSFPYSSTTENDRPSTITEVTEYSSAEKRTSFSSSEDCSNDQVCMLREKRLHTPKTSWRSKISASDEGIEDINEDCSLSCSSHMSTLQLTNIYKVTTPSIDSGNPDNSSPPDNPVFLETEKLIARCIQRTNETELETSEKDFKESNETELDIEAEVVAATKMKDNVDPDLLMPAPVSTCPSPASSEGGVYTPELLNSFTLNLHRIDKDVARCDRGLEYFKDQANLDTLRNIVTTYVWDHLDIGYMQGMCDIVAPLLVVIDDEMTVYSCFSNLMKRMIKNFPTGDQMDHNFANLRVLMQVLDQGLYDSIQENGDFSHFYFCYRWFLLDFKREFSYPHVYRVWETIWAAGHVASPQFGLFIALSLVETYRDIIIDRNMDFTDIIKFFNEMAERHDEEEILETARDMVCRMRRISAEED